MEGGLIVNIEHTLIVFQLVLLAYFAIRQLAAAVFLRHREVAAKVGPVTVELRGDSDAIARFSVVATGNQYACGLTKTSVAYCWGSNNSKFGDGGTADASTPTLCAVHLRTRRRSSWH